MHSKGIYNRALNHPIFQDTTKLKLIIHQRRWLCKHCGVSFNDSFTFVEPHKQSTNLTWLMILNAMKDLNRSTASIARQFHLSDTQVHDIFTAFVDLPRLPLPEFISIDEVYLKTSIDDKYAFVIMDFVSGEIIDIVHNRWMSTLDYYFKKIPIEERKNVRGIISDAYDKYLSSVPEYFPNSISILDSFHTSKYINNSLNSYLNKLIKNLKARDEEKWKERALHLNRDTIKCNYSRDVILLQNYKWVLLKNYDDINHSPYMHYHKILKMNVEYCGLFRPRKSHLIRPPKTLYISPLKSL